MENESLYHKYGIEEDKTSEKEKITKALEGLEEFQHMVLDSQEKIVDYIGGLTEHVASLQSILLQVVEHVMLLEKRIPNTSIEVKSEGPENEKD
jgi:hypothetical protein